MRCNNINRNETNVTDLECYGKERDESKIFSSLSDLKQLDGFVLFWGSFPCGKQKA